jgi:hypothetical protein
VEQPLSLAYPALALERLRGASAVTLPALPPGNAALPDLLALAGVRTLLVAGAPDGVWHGRGGHSVTLNRGGGALHGAIASAEAAAPAAERELAARRREAAARTLWEHLPVSPAPEPADISGATSWGACNPFPVPRRAVVELTPGAGGCPGALRDDGGALHPTQRLRDGPAGERWITALQLAPLQATRLQGVSTAVSTCHWEVSPRVLDNGRLRAEFDRQGGLERLSWDGVFAHWLRPACQLVDAQGQLLHAREVRVLEAGPVRAVVSVVFEQGHLDYGVLAHQSALELSWSGDEALGASCSLPLAGSQPPQIGDCLGVRSTQGLGEHAGISWALAGEGGTLEAGRSLALQLDHPGQVRLQRAHAGLAVALGGRTRFLLHPGPHLPSGVGLDLCPHLPWSGPGHPGQFRLLASPAVAALALAMTAPGETELLLCELAGARSRCQLFPRVHPR